MRYPRPPFPLADDGDDQEPFELSSDYVPTMRDLSEQVGAVSTHMLALHREMALTRAEVVELREYVMSDHAPRITRVEHKTTGLSIPPIPAGAKVGAKYTAIALAIPAVLQALSAIKPSLAGPIEIISQFFGG